MPRPALLATLAALAVMAGCGMPADGGTAADRRAPEPHDLGFGHVHALDLNPADGLVYAGTHHGVFRFEPDGPVRVADRYQDTMGFTIAGPDLFLASGHPGLDEPGPPHLGLIRSTDGARTWTTVSLSGRADFHALSAVGATVYGHDATSGTVMRSDDGGASWQRGAELAAADLDADPTDALRVVATTERGLLESTDGGVTFAPAPAQPASALALVDHVPHTGGDRTPSAVGVDASGGVWALAGGRWESTGALPGAPTAFTVIGADRYLAATAAEVLRSEDAGRTWTALAPVG
ncbi:MAG TPA: exo-alpha-sialidase, partial [Pseudonocardia sp.]|nr:exo-alpha-sialidase [Pseudonocardia sp.]